MLKNAKKTKIVCTLGPVSQSEETLTKLIENLTFLMDHMKNIRKEWIL